MDAALAFDPATLSADLSITDGQIATDADLETAVILSLFCDRRAEADDDVDGNPADRRGWWADAYAAIDGDAYGSRLWLLARAKQTNATLIRAREYVEEALAWMIEDGVATTVTATTWWVRQGLLGIAIEITRPTGDAINYRFEKAWQNV